jgi:mRNA interferase MazF
MEAIKHFFEWIKLKEKLHINTHKPPLFKEGEIWWCSLGENIGVEINGKSNDFTRPVLVFKKLSQDGFLGIPMSTKNKVGSWYVDVFQHGRKVTVILSQMRMFSSNRLHSRLSKLNDDDCKKVSKAFVELYLLTNKKFPPPF